MRISDWSSDVCSSDLGVADTEMEPTALISAILKSPNDLLWFGGIGTYVKAAAQSHGDVGDPANDRLRVNAEQLRVKVVGEGANLGEIGRASCRERVCQYV